MPSIQFFQSSIHTSFRECRDVHRNCALYLAPSEVPIAQIKALSVLFPKYRSAEADSNRSCPLSQLFPSLICSECRATLLRGDTVLWSVEYCKEQRPQPLKSSILELFQTLTFNSLFLSLALSTLSALRLLFTDDQFINN